MACNDECKFWLDNTAKFEKNADAVSTMDEIMYRTTASQGWRRYFLDPTNPSYNDISQNKYISDWIDLVEGEYHEIESYALMFEDDNYFTASVEFEAADTTTHPQSVKEIQKLEIIPDMTFEEFDVTVGNPHGASMQFMLYNPFYDPAVKGSARFYKSKGWKDNWPGWRLCNILNHYLKAFHNGATCHSSVKYYNDAGDQVSKGNAKTYVYHVKLNTLINGPSFINWSVL